MNAQDLIDTTKKRLESQRGRIRIVADLADVSYSWASKFAQGKITNPTVRQLAALSQALDKVEAKDAA